MSLQTMPLDTSCLEFRYHGASEYRAFNKDTEKKDKDQARCEDTGYPIYTIRCQVLFREERESGLITVRVPLPEKPSEDLDFEHPVTFGKVTSKSWNMEGRDGQTWIAKTMGIGSAGGSAATAPDTPPSANRKTKAETT
ncbi:MAG: hypothetical protein ACRBK7_20795 [Acidimicrobiales bacterium]